MRNYNLKSWLGKPLVGLGFIALFCTIIYCNIYDSPFVFDDKRQIVENSKIRCLANYFSIEQLLKPRAIVDLTFALNYKFGKLNVFGYHLVNVLIHIINGFIIYFLALIIFKQLAHFPKVSNSTIFQSSIINHQSIPLMSLFAALIFIAHPIQTQAVTYTVQRYASMAAMFYMASVLFYLKARMTGGRGQGSGIRDQGSEVKKSSVFSLLPSAFYIFSILCGILAFLSKQNTASLPAAILLVEYLFVDRTWQGWKRKIPWFAVAFTFWFLFVLYVSGFFGGWHEGAGMLEDVSGFMRETEKVSRWNYLCTEFNILVIYIRLLFLPVGQSLDYMYPFKTSFFDGHTPLAFLFLAGIVAFGIWNIKKRPVIAFVIFWFFISLSVESSIIPIRDAMYEHRLYMPLFGFSILVAYLLVYFLSNRPVWIMFIFALIVICLGSGSYFRNQVWQSELSLWSDVVSKNIDNYRGWYNRGHVFLRMGKHREAIQQFKKAVSIKPDYAYAWGNLGGAYLESGENMTEQAIETLRRAVSLDPNYSKAWNNLGIAFGKTGRMKEAVQNFQKAADINPEDVQIWNNWGHVLELMNKPGEAIKKFERSISIDPDDANVWDKCGLAFLKTGKPLEAIARFEKAVTIEPDFVETICHIGVALGMTGKLNEAVSKFEKAAAINPDYIDAWINWGNALVKMERLEEALEKYKTVLSLNPKMSNIRKHVMEIKRIMETKKNQ